MKLSTLVRDALYLTWAVPTEALPAPPASLRYEIQSAGERDLTFVSTVLFHHEGLRLSPFPVVKFSYPQLNLLLHVRDGDNIPSLLFHQVLVPGWLAPGARVVLGQPAAPARLRFARPSQESEEDGWSWSVARDGELALSARLGSPRWGDGTEATPRFPSWEAMVKWLRERSRAYTVNAEKLRRLELTYEPTAVWPLAAEIHEDGLLGELLPLAEGCPWPPLYAAWLCPEVPLTLEVAREPEVAVASQVPAPG